MTMDFRFSARMMGFSMTALLRLVLEMPHRSFAEQSPLLPRLKAQVSRLCRFSGVLPVRAVSARQVLLLTGLSCTAFVHTCHRLMMTIVFPPL